MLVEIEQKVVALSELSVHNENLLMEGKAHTKDEAEQLAVKLRTLKGSLQELQRALHDKQLNIQVRDPAATYGHCPHWAYLFWARQEHPCFSGHLLHPEHCCLCLDSYFNSGLDFQIAYVKAM